MGRAQALESVRKNAANALSMANLIMGLSSILCSLNRWGAAKKKKKKVNPVKSVLPQDSPPSPYLPRHYQHSCWLLLGGFLLDLADGAVARQLNACSALGE